TVGEDSLPFTEAANRVFGSAGAWVINSAAWLAAATTLLMGTIYATSRLFYAQARSGYLPRSLGDVHPRRGTPPVGLAVVGAVRVGLVLVGSRAPGYYYAFFSLQVVLAWMVSWLLALVAAVLYRRSFPKEVRGLSWRQPLYPLFPLLGLVGI